MKNLVKLVLVSVFASAASVASAATLDLTANGSGNQGSQIVLGDATVDLITGSYLHVGDFDPNTVCSYTGFSGCVGSFSITWNYDVANVNFDYGYGNTGDSAVVQAFDAFNALVGSVLLNLTSGTSNIDISGLGVFRSLVFDTIAAEWNRPFRDTINGLRFWECMDEDGDAAARVVRVCRRAAARVVTRRVRIGSGVHGRSRHKTATGRRAVVASRCGQNRPSRARTRDGDRDARAQ